MSSQMNLKTLTIFLGWCTVINFGLLIFGGLAWIAVKDGASELAAPLLGLRQTK